MHRNKVTYTYYHVSAHSITACILSLSVVAIMYMREGEDQVYLLSRACAIPGRILTSLMKFDCANKHKTEYS